MKKDIQVIDIGVVPYKESIAFMENTHLQVSQGEQKSTVIITEHFPVITMGKRNNLHDLKIPELEIKKKNIDYHQTSRGGSVTVHEPGQIVVYPILPISPHKLSVRKLVWCMEESMIQLASWYEIPLERDANNPGVYTNNKKIGALGVRVKERVSMHGMALNFNNTLDTFQWVVPCGLSNIGVTSLQKECNRPLDIEVAKKKLADIFIDLIQQFL